MTMVVTGPLIGVTPLGIETAAMAECNRSWARYDDRSGEFGEVAIHGAA